MICNPQVSDEESVWDVLVTHYDQNQDGTITRQEYTHSDEHWARLDKDEDGVLTEAEVNGSGGDSGFRNRRRGRERGGDRGRGGGRRAGGPSFDMSTAAPKVGELAPQFSLPVLVREKKIQWELNLETSWTSALTSAVASEKEGAWGIAVKFPSSEEFEGFQAKARNKTVTLLREKMTLATFTWQTEKGGAVFLKPTQAFNQSTATLLAAQLAGNSLDLSVFQTEKPVALIFGSYT